MIEIDRRAEVFAERAAHLVLHHLHVAADERVHHQRDVALARMTRVAPRLAIDRDALGELLDLLPEQVREQVRADLTRLAEGLGRSGGGDPDGQVFLHRARQRA